MQYNFTPDTAERIIRYMDGEGSVEEREAVETLLQTDAAAQEQYQFFLAAKRAVRSEGTRQRVAGIQRDYLEEREILVNKPASRKKRSFFTPFTSVAAVLMFLLIGYSTIQYLTTTNQQVYDEAFISYQLPVSRGSEATSQLESLYNTGNYVSVISAFNATPAKSQKDYFIAGLSYLQLNKPDDAVKTFQQVETLNAGSEKKRYVQETDYYLMLAYLKAGEITNAEKKLDKIRSDKGHTFYEKAGTISRTKLMILKWKEK